MIYLIITTSINNRYGIQDQTERQERYLYAISETLKVLPYEIKPLIVENNGERSTYLDNFYHNQQRVKVFYTNNNKQLFKSKGINELLDIKEVIDKYGIKEVWQCLFYSNGKVSKYVPDNTFYSFCIDRYSNGIPCNPTFDTFEECESYCANKTILQNKENPSRLEI